MTPEALIKFDIRKYLDSLGDKCWHAAYTNNGYGKKGTPDRLVCYRGRFLAIEVKSAPDREPTPWQNREIALINGAGGRAIVVWSVEQVKAVVKEIDSDLDLSEANMIEAVAPL